MDFSLTKEQKALKKEVLEFARNELSDDVVQRDRDSAFSREDWDKCGKLKLQGLPVPVELGGRGLSPLDTILAMEAFGLGCEDGGLILAVGAHLFSAVIPMWLFGNDDQKKKYLAGLCNGELVGVLGMTEPNSGSHAFGIETRAEPGGDGYVLNGTKIFISNAPLADVAIIVAVTDPEKGYHGGFTAFLVEKGTPGFTTEPDMERMGLRTAQLGKLVLENVKVGPEAMLGKVGGGSSVFTRSMDWERIGLFAAHLGTMERLLDTTVAYARKRKLGGTAIGKHQAVAHKLVDSRVNLEASRWLTYRAASGLGSGITGSLYGAMTKVMVSESLLKMAADAVQIHGAYGYLTEFGIERALRDAVSGTIYSGSSEMQRNIIARWLGL